MNLVYKARVGLIRFAKVFPFLLCFIVLVSLSETLFALLMNDFVLLDGSLIPNTHFSWLIAEFYTFGIYSLILALVFAISFETCIYNKASIGYLAIFLGQKQYFITIELEPTTIYIICLANIIASGYFIYKGVTIFLKSAK